MKKRLQLLLLVLSILPLVDLLHLGIPAGHDTPDHVARIANFYQSLTEGNIVPRWAGNLNWGYGHPILMFLYPLPSYIASLFRAIGFSFVDATKLVFGLSYIASLFTMYWWVGSQWGRLAGLVASVLYGFAPYRFVDLYVRGAIGEHVAFVFPPLIFLGFLKLARADRNMVRWGMLASLAIAGLILSHNAVSLMLGPVILFYWLYLLIYEAKDRVSFLVPSFWFLVLGFSLAAFFWMPAFLEGKYTLRDIVTRGEFSDRFVPPLWLLWSPWNYGGGNEFVKQLGIAQWIAVAGSVMLLVNKKVQKVRWFIAGSLAMLLLSLFFMTKASLPVWQTVTILQKFQFPWRLLTVSVFVIAVMGGVLVSLLSKKLALFVSIFFLFVSLVSTTAMWRAKAYIVRPESYYTGIYDSTTDTGESSPIWSVRFMERRPKAPLQVIDGKAEITQVLRTTTRRIYRVKAEATSRLVENTLYFPGWKVFVDGIGVGLQFQDPAYRGLMTFWIEPGQHTIEIRFGETKLRMFAKAISLAGLVLLAGTSTILLWTKR